ncbi:unnamed protein product [Phytophthora fragariaefolia]|uniref:Unnamed protein product n=1 Tax=Phytophthora fragariaefolia TaxID=1490495 RepID=A0A9W6TTA1_9STRA|nr:unnamed protein product [Phytophthora fragariaefolia]
MIAPDDAAPSLAAASQSWNWAALSQTNVAPSASQSHDKPKAKRPMLLHRVPTSTQAETKPKTISTATERAKPVKVNNETVEEFSKLRITDRAITAEVLRQEMEGRKFIKLQQMDRAPKDTFTNGEVDWVTIGVLTRKTLSKPTANGSTFMVWGLSDLDGTELGVFLFGDAYVKHWKELTGSVIAVLNAALMPATEKNKFAFKATQPSEVVKLGKALDFGICKGTTSGEARCRLAVNTAKTQYCLHHIATNFMQAGRGRQQLNNSTGSLRKALFAGLAKPKNLSAGVYTSAPSKSSNSGWNPVFNKKRKRNDTAGGVLGVPTVLSASGAVVQLCSCQPSTLASALHQAVVDSREQIVRALLAAGADVTVADKKGVRPMDLMTWTAVVHPTIMVPLQDDILHLQQRNELQHRCTIALSDTIASLQRDEQNLIARAQELQEDVAATRAFRAGVDEQIRRAKDMDRELATQIEAEEVKLQWIRGEVARLHTQNGSADMEVARINEETQRLTASSAALREKHERQKQGRNNVVAQRSIKCEAIGMLRQFAGNEALQARALRALLSMCKKPHVRRQFLINGLQNAIVEVLRQLPRRASVHVGVCQLVMLLSSTANEEERRKWRTKELVEDLLAACMSVEADSATILGEVYRCTSAVFTELRATTQLVDVGEEGKCRLL